VIALAGTDWIWSQSAVEKLAEHRPEL